MNLTRGYSKTAIVSAANDSFRGLAPDPFAEVGIFAFGSAIYMLVISFITTLANGVLLVVFLVDPLKTLKSPTSYFLIALAINDLLNGMIHLPLYSSCFIMTYLQGPMNGLILCRDVLHNVAFTQSSITMTTSFLIVFAFTVTQFIVVSSPGTEVRSQSHFTKNCNLRSCVLCVFHFVLGITILGNFHRVAF